MTISLPHTEEQFARYSFDLSAEQEARAARLHRESTIIDMMFAGPCGHRSFTSTMEDELRSEWEKHRDVNGVLFSSILMPGSLAIRSDFSLYKKFWDLSGVTAGSRILQIGSYEMLARFSSHYTAEFDHLSWLIKALRAGDIRKAKAKGKHAGFFYCQPLTPISPDLRLLEMAYDLGLRMLQLTYNKADFVGVGCTEPTDGGLSRFGHDLVACMNDLGIIVDTSHCGPQTTIDACKASAAPVTACHTSAKSVCDHARAKSDVELHAIAETGGVIGIYMVPFFLSTDGNATIDHMLDHIEFISALVGWEYVGIGTDWPMSMPNWLVELALRPALLDLGFRKQDLPDRGCPSLVGFEDYRDFPNITRGLVKRGFSDDQIRGILGENFMRVFEAVCG